MTNPDELNQISPETAPKDPETPLKQPDLVDIVIDALWTGFLDKQIFASVYADREDNYIKVGDIDLFDMKVVARTVLNAIEDHGAILVRNHWASHMRSMLGRQVAVVLDRDGGPDGAPVVARGLLLSFTEDGEVVLREDDGMVRYCWPNLSTELV